MVKIKKSIVWVPVVDDIRYEVSNHGNIRNAITKNILQGTVTEKGYRKYAHMKGAKYGHRIVAMAFLSNPKNLPEVNHKDFNRLNNFMQNLEWCDRTYNVRYSTKSNR